MPCPPTTEGDIALVAFNARWAHCAHALRLLRAGLGDLRPRCRIHEFTIADDPRAAAERVLATTPRLIGISCSVWNLAASCAFCEAVRAAAPQTVLVAGGPEVGLADHPPQLRASVDTLVTGEGESTFATLARDCLAGVRPPPVIHGTPLEASKIPPAAEEYTAEDCAHRLVYLETTRGCPHRCGYCTSAVAGPLRRLPAQQVRATITDLIARGATTLKFLDRSINAEPEHAAELLAFCATQHRPGLRVHLEMLPDRFTEQLHRAIAAYPADGLQLEIGLQSLDPTVLAASGRRCDIAAALAHLRRLAATGVHLHLDLIAGLPGERLSGIAHGFDTLYALGPQEIQLGILKRLRDTPFAALALPGHHFESTPPYALLASPQLSFATVQALRRFARYFERIHNAGDLPRTAHLLCAGPSAFAAFMAVSEFLWARFGRTHAIAFSRLCNALHAWLIEHRGCPPDTVTDALAADWAALPGRKGPPACIQETVRRLRHAR